VRSEENYAETLDTNLAGVKSEPLSEPISNPSPCPSCHKIRARIRADIKSEPVSSVVKCCPCLSTACPFLSKLVH
jgi:hypothetical protein